MVFYSILVFLNSNSYSAVAKNILTKEYYLEALDWVVCQVSVQLDEPKLDFKVSVLLVKKQLKTAAGSYPVDAKLI